MNDGKLAFGIGFIVGLAMLIAANLFRIREHQSTLETLVDSAAMTAEHEQGQETKLWDLHRRVLALEAEDERLSAHIKWFVMRRSGTDELRKMEAAIKKLEEDERAGD